MYFHNCQTETAIFLATKHEKKIMACSYLHFSIQKIHQNSKKNGGFCEESLSENDLEAVLVNFCCYEYGANTSEAVQKISTRAVLKLCQLIKTANFIASYTHEKTYLAVYYLLIGDTSQVSVLSLKNKNEFSFCFLLDLLTSKHCRTYSSMINLWIDSRTCQK